MATKHGPRPSSSCAAQVPGQTTVDEVVSLTNQEEDQQPLRSFSSARCQSGRWRALWCIAFVSMLASICVLISQQHNLAKAISTRADADHGRGANAEGGRGGQYSGTSSKEAGGQSANDPTDQFKQFLHTGSWKNGDTHKYDALVRKMAKTVPIGGLVEGHAGQVRVQQLFYHGLAKLPFVKVVCEIGFNAGHSSCNWLSAKPGIKLFSFDLGGHYYTRPRAAFLQKEFPGQTTITLGNSSKTVPVFHRDHPDVKCDIVVVDGGHSEGMALADLENMRYLANQYFHVLVMDDVDCRGVGLHDKSAPRPCLGPERALLTHMANGQVGMNEMINTQPGRGFSAGRYIFP